MFIKLGQKHASKDEIELAVFEAFGEVLVEALSFGLGVAELVLVRGLAVLLVNGLSFVHTVVYDTYKQTPTYSRFIYNQTPALLSDPEPLLKPIISCNKRPLINPKLYHAPHDQVLAMPLGNHPKIILRTLYFMCSRFELNDRSLFHVY